MSFVLGKGRVILKKKHLDMLCEKCQKNKKEKLHCCAFRSEINEDQTECNCCKDCTALCAEEV